MTNIRWHGCECKTDDRDGMTYGRSLNQKLEYTKKISDYIRQSGFTLVEMWECQWRLYKKNCRINNRYVYPTEHIFRMSEQEILQHIENGDIFGVAEVDIHVPANLKCYFQEMPPIFKIVTVTRNDIGDFMRDFLEHNQKTFKDTRYLIGSMFATKILIITPLLRWYIAHGVIVTKMYLIIEFNPKRCFK